MIDCADRVTKLRIQVIISVIQNGISMSEFYHLFLPCMSINVSIMVHLECHGPGAYKVICMIRKTDAIQMVLQVALRLDWLNQKSSSRKLLWAEKNQKRTTNKRV